MSSKKILNSFDIGEDYVIKKNNRKEEVVIEVVVD